MTKQPDPRSFDDKTVAAETSDMPRQETLPALPGSPNDDPPDDSDHDPQADQRHDGWTPTRQAAFLRELAASHNVSAAARAVGMSRQSAYKLRVRLRGEPFDAAWKAAFATRFDVLAEAALDRALHGVEVQHYYNGELVGTSRRYDERLTLALLAKQNHYTPRQPYDHLPASAFQSDDLAGLIERVESGPEEWLEDSNEELDAFYGKEESEVASDENDGPTMCDGIGEAVGEANAVGKGEGAH